MTAPSANEATAKRNALVLSAAQAFYNIVGATVMNIGAIIGASMLLDKSNATLPITAMSVGTMLATIPASLFMQRFGRRLGLQIGALLGIAGSLLAAYAVYHGAFALFCAATFLLGLFQSTSQFYRFAAADTASPAFRPRAISWVLAGGLVAALFVPMIIEVSKDWTVPFAGCFLATAVSALVTLLVLSFVDIPLPEGASGSDTGRPLAEIAAQPRFIGAVLAGMVAFGMMTLSMTATPLAMLGCGFSLGDSTSTIRWHVIAMFAPSFFTGDLIVRFGKERIVLAGMVLLALSGVLAILGLQLWNFTLGLILLGLGWNFGFIGATAMVTDCHTPAERGKVQALNDLLVFGFVAFTTWLSGAVFASYGWATLNAVLLAAVALGAAAVLVVGRRPATA